MTRRGFSSMLRSSSPAAAEAAPDTGKTSAKTSAIPAENRRAADRGSEEEANWEARWRRGEFRQQQQDAKPERPESQGRCHLDSTHEELTQRLRPKRDRLVASIEEQLLAYDELDDHRSKVDAQFECRDSYEMHIRGEASRELRRALENATLDLHQKKLRLLRSSRHLEGSVEKSRDAHVVIIGLMAVHITTQTRLQKLTNTLQSIEAQDLSNCNAELHMAVSWYSSDTTLAMKVQELFHHFIASRKKRHPSDESNVQATRGARAEGRNSFARFAAARQTEPDPTSSPSTSASSSCPATLVIRQTKRCTQFQHYRAALDAIEAELCWRWGVRPGTGDSRSIWVMFGDDDDLWHCRRAAEYAKAVAKHPEIESVASMATLTRVGIGLFEGQKSVPEDALPDIATQVDEYLNHTDRSGKPYKGANHADDEVCQKYQKQLARDGGTDEPPPQDIMMEHFDFSPRLRILHEFFETTSEEILAHRYCDLRLCEFLETYPRFGRELGLELSFFKPKCWMYFYRNQGVDPDSITESIEESQGGDANAPLPDMLFAGVEHVSAEVPISNDVVHMARRHCKKFKEHDAQMTQAKLAKHLALFRGMMEHYLVRLHTRKIDQRRLDGLVVANAMQSFGRFAQSIADSNLDLSSDAALLMLETCQTIAARLANHLGVDVFWYRPDSVIVPEKIFVDEPQLNTGGMFGLPLGNGIHPSAPWLTGKGKSKGKGKGYLQAREAGYTNPQLQHGLLPPAPQEPQRPEEQLVHFKWRIPGAI